MKLYRTISKEELMTLKETGKVEGLFTGLSFPLNEKKGSSYNGEFGGVVCCFTIPRFYGFDPEYLIEIEVNEDEVLGTGFGRYCDVLEHDSSSELVLDIKEVYLRSYSIQQVKWVGGMADDYEEYLPKGEVAEIVGNHDPADDILGFNVVRVS